MTESKYHDDVCIPKWKGFLKRFNPLSEKPITDETKADAELIKSDAINTGKMTPRQVEGIVARCNHYINGTYGKKTTA